MKTKKVKEKKPAIADVRSVVRSSAFKEQNTIDALIAIRNQMKTCEENIGKERDKLRNLMDELNDFLEPVEQGARDLDSAIEYLDCAIESMSEVV